MERVSPLPGQVMLAVGEEDLGDYDLIERGYAAVSKQRGYTAIRMSWIRKPKTGDASVGIVDSGTTED